MQQWVKNVFVFLPIFFAGRFSEPDFLYSSLWAFILFCLVASCVYVLNDLSDIEKDKLHPEKKNRPLPSGEINKNSARFFLIALLVLIVSLCYVLMQRDTINIESLVLLGIYFVINLAYSFGLKNVAILDVNLIAVGFLLRVIFGGEMTGLIVSKWALLLTYSLALVLALGKRRGEIIKLNAQNKTRKVLEEYNEQMLNISLAIVSSITIICYIMYTLSPEATAIFEGQGGVNYLFLSVIFVIMGILRYLQQSLVFNKTESPVKFLYTDWFLQLTIVAWVLLFAFILYF